MASRRPSPSAGGCNGGGRELVASDTYGEADAQLARNFQIDTDANVLPLTPGVDERWCPWQFW